MKIEDLKNAKHSYYCNDNNYYSNDSVFTFDTFAEFLDEMGKADMDCNLLFRWDVKAKYCEETEDDLEGEYSLFLYWMHQRKGRFVVNIVENFTQEDVQTFLEYVKPRFEHLKSLWEPLV